MNKIVIAIDGFSSCGKSTMAKNLAKTIQYIYIDSGAMYRAVALFCIQEHLIIADDIDVEALRLRMKDINISFQINKTTGLPETYLNGVNVENNIRSMEVSNKVSQVAAIDFVRSEMVLQQQKMGESKGIVMDGRDIGTTVFPKAELKIFVTASAQVRAQRRYDEMLSKTGQANYNDILENIEKRDYIDQNREVSPLKQASDALILDNSNMTISEQQQWLIDQYNKVISSRA